MAAQNDDAIRIDLHSRRTVVSATQEPRDALPRSDWRSALARLGPFLPRQLLFATDFDGTLAPIVQDPDSAQALPASIHLIEELAKRGAHVAVISGRAQNDLRGRLPMSLTRILGENGMVRVTTREREGLDRFNQRAARLVAQVSGVRMERRSGSTSIHYRGAEYAGHELWKALVPIANRHGLMATHGRRVIEITPRRADKSRAMAVMIARVQPKAVIYAGDDEPDHNVFRLLRNSPRRHLAIGVCSQERTVDRFRECEVVVDGPEGMAAFLRALLDWISGGLPSQPIYQW